MKKFAIIGVGGYIAPRHLEAIKELGGTLVAAYDVSDSVGILDRYFPDCSFFTNFEQFNDFLETRKLSGDGIDFISVCSPNYMHSAHIKFGLRIGADVICEKPLVLTEKEVLDIIEVEKATGKRVFTVLQLRVHDSIIALKKKIESRPSKKFEIDLNYMTSRGDWYHKSWKGDVRKSGGLSTNIGVHFFDMLTWIFGEPLDVTILESSPSLERGVLELEKAKVNWMLTVDRNKLPYEAVSKGKTTFRSIKIDGEEFEFSEGFTDLHKRVYADILSGKGYGAEESVRAIKIVEKIRGL